MLQSTYKHARIGLRSTTNMRGAALILLFICFVESRKLVQIDKHANIDFINMETGGMKPPVPKAPVRAPVAAPGPAPGPAPAAPAPTTKAPVPTPKPAVVLPPSKPVQPVQPVKPAQPTPALIKPIPVNPAPVANPITTPGPGSVKSLVNYYNSQGKGSPIRPYTYSQAVKQG